MENRKCILSVARQEYLRWITDPRIVVVGVLIIFMRTLAVEPLLERAEKIGIRLGIFEPYIAIGNSGMLVMLMPCVFLILIGDYPKITGNTLFFIQRTGKWNWFIGQILFIVYAVLTFLGLVIIGSILVSGGRPLGGWSDAVTKYNAMFPDEAENFASQLIPSNLYNQLSMWNALLQTTILMAMYLFLLALVIYFFKEIHIQSFGLFASIIVISAGVVTTSLDSRVMWGLPMANTIVWIHYDKILEQTVVPVWFSYVYFAVAITAMLILNEMAVRRLELLNIELVE